jgi:hypothetical protein
LRDDHFGLAESCWVAILALISRGGDEMAVRAVNAAFLLSILLIAGCGTAANLVKPGPEKGGDGKCPFGGVNQDMECIQTAANGELGFRKQPRAGGEQYPQTALILFCAVDLPFSFIGDVVTWPYTSAYTFINQPIPVPAVLQGQLAPPPPPGQPAPAPLVVTQVPADARPLASPPKFLPTPR